MNTQKERLSKRSLLLDTYENQIGLPPNLPPGDEGELQEYLIMDRQVIEAMSPDKAYSISVRMSQYGFYLQRCINRDKSILTWADSELTKLIAKHLSDYDQFTKYEAKVALICRENVAAQEIQDIKSYASQRIDRLSELSAGIRNLSYVISLGFKMKMGETK